MKTEFKHICFEKIEQKHKTSVWGCESNSSGDQLGVVMWYPSWRQYCFFPDAEVLFSGGCLSDIQEFMTGLRKEETDDD